MARKIDINEIIKKAISEIITKALQAQKDTTQFNKNALYALWLMRGQIHKIEENLLQSDKESIHCGDKTSDYENLKIGQIAQEILKPLLENTQWSDDVLKSFLNKNDSNEIFGINYSLLSPTRFDKHNYPRYYKNQINVNGKYYFFCSQWNEPARTKLVNFINQYSERKQ